MHPSVTLLKVRGVPVGAHWTWLLVFALVVWSLATALFPATYPGLEGSVYVAMGLTAALLVFGSVLLHELGHAFRALAEGVPIEGITLWLFGGVARLRGNPPAPGAEFRVAVAGPLVTVLITAVFGGLAFMGDAVDVPASVQGVVDYLARINLIILGFNLVPALPLDGGRVLRAWLWRRQQSFSAATRSAARAGQAFGAMLVAVGVLSLVTERDLGGLWLAFIGWFLIQAAQAEAVTGAMRELLGGLRVRDVMTTDADVTDSTAALTTVGADQDLLVALSSLGDEADRATVVEGDRAVGVLSRSDVAHAMEVARARPRRRPPARKPGVAVWVVVGGIILVAGAALYHPPYAVVAPGQAVDVAGDVTITGVPVDEVNGRYLLTSVHLSRPSALRTLIAALRDDRQVVPLSQVLPEGVDAEQYIRSQREVFRESRMMAAAAAASAARMPVSITGTGARVVEVLRSAPADDELRRGDVIVAVNGQDVDDALALRSIVQSRPAGSDFRMAVERGSERVEIEISSRRLPSLSGGVGLGVLVETRGLQVDLPFEVDFDDRNVGGPSAGLAYALAILDKITEGDEARGRTIGATGTVDTDGDVGPVGGVEQKAVAAREAGASLFLVPAQEVEEARRAGIEVRGVTSVNFARILLSGTA